MIIVFVMTTELSTFFLPGSVEILELLTFLYVYPY